jgi:hypothetical protein
MYNDGDAESIDDDDGVSEDSSASDSDEDSSASDSDEDSSASGSDEEQQDIDQQDGDENELMPEVDGEGQ